MNKNALSIVAGSAFLGLLSEYQRKNKGSKSHMFVGEKIHSIMHINLPNQTTIKKLRLWPEDLGYFDIHPNYTPYKNQDERDALIGKILTMIRENVSNVKGLKMRNNCFGANDFHLLRMFPELEMLDLGESEQLLYLNRWLHETKLKSLPQDLLNLRNLKRLSLSKCEIESFPMDLLQMEQLEALVLHGNNIKTIPHEISVLTDLKYLNLGNCHLSEFPNEILSLSELTNLIIDDNNLKQIPDDISLLSNLEILRLRSTNISKLPDSIGMLTNLKYLDISMDTLYDQYPNSITELPYSFGGLINLEGLRLNLSRIHTSHNQIARWLHKGLPPKIINKFISSAKIDKVSSQLRRF